MNNILIPSQTRPRYSYTNVRIGLIYLTVNNTTHTNKISVMNIVSYFIVLINHYIELRPEILSMS